MNCVGIRGLEAFETDSEIPLRYGVDQCVGDTLCIGGTMYGSKSHCPDAGVLPGYPGSESAGGNHAELQEQWLSQYGEARGKLPYKSEKVKTEKSNVRILTAIVKKPGQPHHMGKLNGAAAPVCDS